MLRFSIGRVPVAVSFWFFALVACFALADRLLLWILVLPIVIHELGHLLVLWVLRVPVRAVTLTALGIDIRRGPTRGLGREVLISLGGVLANLAAAGAVHLLCFHSMRVLFLVAANLAVALFSLAPIGDLDGGQVLSLLAVRLFSPAAALRIEKGASVLVLAALVGFAGFLLLIGIVNFSLLLTCGYFAWRVLARS